MDPYKPKIWNAPYPRLYLDGQMYETLLLSHIGEYASEWAYEWKYLTFSQNSKYL